MTLVKAKPTAAASNGSQTPKTDPKDLKAKPIQVNLKDADNQSPLEDRMLKVQHLADLVDKREKFAASLKKLQSINTSSEGKDLQITIEDSKTEWETFNTEAIRLCIASLIESHKTKLAELDKQICW